MADIFGRRPLSFGGAFAADAACIELTLDCVDLAESITSGILTQQLSIQYQQPITRLYEVGTQATYFVAGRPQGTCTIARVLGPGIVLAAFYECIGDVCNADANDLCFCLQANCTGAPEEDYGAMRVCLKNIVLQGIGISVAAQDMVINEQMSIFFTAMLIQDDEAGCQCQDTDTVTCDCFT